MIKSIEKLRAALKRGDYSGVVLYDGPWRANRRYSLPHYGRQQ